MARDFTLIRYRELLTTFLDAGYEIVPVEELYNQTRGKKRLLLRHDVDDLPVQSLKKAQIEKDLGVRSTYYFRIVEESNHPVAIRAIAELGHEIGYHYEDLSLANGEFDKARLYFEKNLEYFRNFYPVRTICMHGSPTSIWDNRMIWRELNYHDYGIMIEPYFDIDFSKTLYLTDTGRRWDGNRVSVRDKVKDSFQQKFHYRHTGDITSAIQRGGLPDEVMITTHPQRWLDELWPWTREFILQNIKNSIKKNFYVQNPFTD